MINFLILLLLSLSQLGFGAIIQSQVNTQSRLGYHLVSPNDLSSHRHELELNTLIRFPTPWSIGGGFRALVEGAYASNSSRYSDPVRTRDTQDFILRDLFLQYKDGPVTLKLGNQQVIWGEAFGFYYADLINPKDFRDFGIGPLDRNRLHTPMINFKWNLNENIFQLLYVVKPFFNKTPNIGSDFAFPFGSFFSPGTFTFDDERTLPITNRNAEYGGRFSPDIPGADLSFLYFNYFDRAPVYLSTNSNGTDRIEGKHFRLETFGTTLSVPISILVLRSELLFHRNKSFTQFNGALDSFKSDQILGVLGLDYIVGDRWRIGLQLSESYRTRSLDTALEKASQQLATFHGSFTVFKAHVFDLLLAYAPHDGGSLTELSYTIPLNNRVDMVLAADLFNGGPQSQFGLYYPASRGYFQIKTLLGNESKL